MGRQYNTNIRRQAYSSNIRRQAYSSNIRRQAYSSGRRNFEPGDLLIRVLPPIASHRALVRNSGDRRNRPDAVWQETAPRPRMRGRQLMPAREFPDLLVDGRVELVSGDACRTHEDGSASREGSDLSGTRECGQN